jgi:hypothetical protein
MGSGRVRGAFAFVAVMATPLLYVPAGVVTRAGVELPEEQPVGPANPRVDAAKIRISRVRPMARRSNLRRRSKTPTIALREG